MIGKKDDRVIGCSQDILNEILQTTLPVDATLELSKEVTAEEIKSVMFSIDGDKAPGLDGYTAHFFKCAWTVVKEDVVNAILYFFQTSKMHPTFNSTTVVLVMKC